MKIKLLFLLLLASLSSYSQYTTIPDVIFENKLISLGIDKDGRNGKVATTSIKSITSLDLTMSDITDLSGIQDFTALISLDCSLNKLTTLDLSKNINLMVLNCLGNELTSLNVFNLSKLNTIICSENKLTILDVSSNTALTTLFCMRNNLISLNVKNGNNINFKDFLTDFRNNPLLSCIQVDNPTYSDNKWLAYKDNTAIYSSSCGPSYTTIPNLNFEKKLISLGIDKDGQNGKVLTSSIISLTTLDVSNSAITDLTGIENFLSLVALNVSNNQLTNLNLTSQKKIKSLDCSTNLLKILDLYENDLLVSLDFSNNQLSTLDLWRQQALVTLKGAANVLTSLDISGNSVLKTIEVDSNKLTNLTVSQNKFLSILKCNNNLLTALDISQNSALVSLVCSNNLIVKLDLTANPLLKEISCESNKLGSLNLKNGKNSLFTTYDFRNNPSLQCIEVDNEVYSTTNWSSKKDPATTYNFYCGPFTLIPDAKFEDKLIALGIDIDGKNGKTLTINIENLSYLDLSNSSISSLTGIQDFINLRTLNVSGNQLASIEITKNVLLQVFNCSNNQIENLDFTKHLKLTDLYCNNNNLNVLNLKNGKNSLLRNIDFRNNPNLSCILVDNESYSNNNWIIKKDAAASYLTYCGAYTLIPDSNFENRLIQLGIDYDGKNGKVLTSSIAELTSLNLKNDSYGNFIVNLIGIQDFKKLVTLECSNNKISNLDISKNIALETLDCSNNSITSLTLSNNTALVSLIASRNQLTNLDLSSNLQLKNLDLSNNLFTVISVTSNTALTSLNCAINGLTQLDISQNKSLKTLECSRNSISTLDVSNNLSLSTLYCNFNSFTSLNLDKNIALTDINCSANPLSSISLDKNINLVNFDCEYTDVKTINLKNGNNSKIIILNLKTNSKLYCIQVDNKVYSDSNWSNYKDSYDTYFENCSETVNIPDQKFENKLIALGIDNDGQNGKVYKVLIYNVKSLDLSNSNISSLSGIEYFENLTDLNCDSNNLTALDVSNNKLLEYLSCNQNKISALDISNNKILVNLYCTSNSLTSLNLANGNNKNFNFNFGWFPDFSKNPNLTCINVDDVAFSNINWSGSKDPDANYSRSCGATIDIQDVNLEQKLVDLGIDKDGVNGTMLKSEALNVTTLDISSSNITNLAPLAYFPELQTLNCSGNKIQELQLQSNSKLTTLNCSNNNLILLDLTKNKLLTSLDSSNNKLISATIKNGTNINLLSVNFINNNGLSCIEVDDATVSNTKWSKNKDNTAVFSTSCGVYTLIPDENFEYKLISLGIDTDGKNGKVLTQNVSNITDLNLSNGQIKNLTGIQDFVALTSLNLENNLLTNLNVAKNTALQNLNCAKNKLSIIDLNINVNLTDLNFDNNLLTNLDLTNNVALLNLSCLSNQLTALNVTKCVTLKHLICSKNNLAELDLTFQNKLELLKCNDNFIKSLPVFEFKKLVTLDCSSNQLASLVFSRDAVITELNCSYNNLTVLELPKFVSELQILNCSNNQLVDLDVTNFYNLKKIYCSYNKLKILDLSSKSSLSDVYADHNQLVSLDFSNLSYWGVPHIKGDITNNPDLECINVHYIWVPKYWPLIKDDKSYYSDNCPKNITLLDATFEDKLIALGIDKDGKNGKILTASIASITTLDVSNSAIVSLKGIEDFAALQQLNCKGNKLKFLDFSENKALKSLDCSNNQLTRLNLKNGNNTAMDDAGLVNNYTNNPALNCIQVENPVYANANWASKKDAKANYSEDCTVYTLIPDSNFEEQLIAQGIDIDGENGKVDTSRIDYLESLDISFKSISDLTGIQDFIALQQLYCSGNQLTSLDVSKNTALTVLHCYSNELTTLDVSKNVALTELSCKLNQLASLNVSNNPALTFLTCRVNKLTTLDVSKSIALTSLYCYSNELKSLDVSKNIALTTLQTFSNQLTTLDVSKNTLLTELYCNDNKLLNLNLKNGNNTLLNSSTTDFRGNTSLTCIQVDNVTYSDANWTNLKDNTAIYSENCTQSVAYTLIPDLNFEKKLIALNIDKDGQNGKVLTSSIASLTFLDVSNSSIADITGIQDFAALKSLYCNGNLLKTVNVSKNTALNSLSCYSNFLTSLNVTENLSLTRLYCSQNLITSLDVSKNILLTNLSCGYNQLTSLNVTQNVLLTSLTTSSNQLSALDLSKNPLINYLTCGSNKLTSLNVSGNILLTTILCSTNQLTSLDVSKNINLTSFTCDANNLNFLNLKNGKNSLFDVNNTSFKNNPALTCIQVDNAAYSNTNWTNIKDLTANYSTDCTQSVAYTLIPDPNFEKKLIALGIDSGVIDGKVLTSNINTLTSLDLYNTDITDLTGIQGFVALKILKCNGYYGRAGDGGNGKLTSLDVSKNTLLTVLDCSYNQITSLDVSKNVLLISLNYSVNKLTNVDVSKNVKLDNLDCSSNNILNLDVSKIATLRYLSCDYTQLTTLDLSNNFAIVGLSCSNSKLSSLNLKNGRNGLLISQSINFKGNPSLSCILVDDVAFSTANWANAKDATANYSTDCQSSGSYTLIPDPNFEKKLIALGIDSGVIDGKVLTSNINTLTSLNVSYSSITDLTGIQGFAALTKLDCYGNYGLKSLDVSKNIALTSLDCNNSYLITSLDVSKNTKLTSLNCYYNKLSSLNVSKNTALISLQCSSNQLTALDVTLNTALTELNCAYNPITNLDVTLNSALTSLDCTSNKLTILDVSKNLKLTELWSGNNQLTNLDVTKNILLTSLICNTNLLTTLDVSKNIALTRLLFYNNKITNINVSQNTALSTMDCNSNLLTSLDVSKNIELNYLYCDNNQLTNLDLTTNGRLGLLDCSNNQLTRLDVSKNTNLSSLKCAANKLINLNLKNGNNTLFDRFANPDPLFIIYNIDFRNNPNLTCIQVDNTAYSVAKWNTQKDATAQYSENCGYPIVLPANNFIFVSKAETCLGENNGEISITAKISYPYVANINGIKLPFVNNALKIADLPPGSYAILITIPGENFEQSLVITINTGELITATSNIVSHQATIVINSGTAPYKVFLNGIEKFETNDSTFTVNVEKNGLLEVKTALDCEGIYAVDITGLQNSIPSYPNPTSGKFEIELPTTKKEVTIELYTFDAHLISKGSYSVENGKVQLTLENQPTGVYIVKVELDTTEYLKIIKL